MTEFKPGDRVRVRLDFETVLDLDGDVDLGKATDLDARYVHPAYLGDAVQKIDPREVLIEALADRGLVGPRTRQVAQAVIALGWTPPGSAS